MSASTPTPQSTGTAHTDSANTSTSIHPSHPSKGSPAQPSRYQATHHCSSSISSSMERTSSPSRTAGAHQQQQQQPKSQPREQHRERYSSPGRVSQAGSWGDSSEPMPSPKLPVPFSLETDAVQQRIAAGEALGVDVSKGPALRLVPDSVHASYPRTGSAPRMPGAAQTLSLIHI